MVMVSALLSDESPGACRLKEEALSFGEAKPVRRRLRAFFNHPGCVGLAQPDGVRIAGSQPHALEVDGLGRAWVAAVEDRAAGHAVDSQMDGVDQVIEH
jgi:hypothetical protein